VSATAIDIHTWIYAQHDEVPTHIHPSAQARCHQLIDEMHHAAEAGDNDELARLLETLRWKITDEIEWEAAAHV
jgi:hypothetical protein